MTMLFLLAISTLGLGSALDVTPLQKVVQMLEEVKAKGQKEKHEEEVEFAKFHEWCDQVRADKTRSIKELGDEIMQKAADIDAAEADAETLAEEIGELEKEIASLTADLNAAKKIRAKTNADYKVAHQEISE